MTQKQQLWGKHDLEKKTITFRHSGELGIWLNLTENEIRLASKKIVPSETATNPPENLNWLRWTFDQNAPELTINPMLPDKPLVVKIQEPFYLPPRSHTRIFIRMPIWIKVYLAGRKKTVTLLEAPTIQLSKTWFGSFTSGELCYSLSSSASQEMDTDPDQPHLALVTCRLINLGADALLVKKLCLQTGHLSIFEHEGLLLTDQLQINYRGGNEISQVKVAGKPPKEFSRANLISSPRISGSKTLAARTFAPLRNLPGLGIPSDWN